MNHLIDYATLLDSEEPPKSLKLATPDQQKANPAKLKKAISSAASEGTEKHRFLQRKSAAVTVGEIEAERKAKLKQIRQENKKLLDAIQKRKEENYKIDEGKYGKKKKLTVIKVRYGEQSDQPKTTAVMKKVPGQSISKSRSTSELPPIKMIPSA